MKKNLIIARCAADSLYPHWLTGAPPDFDVVLTFYDERMPEVKTAFDRVVDVQHLPGSKWRGLHQYLASSDRWKSYDRILLPDDDLLLNASDLNKFFALCEALGADLAQPALDSASHFSWPVTLAHESFIYRHTTMVEIMCPCLSARLLTLALPYFAQTHSGWGLDFQWAEMLRSRQWGTPIIIDAVTMTHTRAAGSLGHGVGASGVDPKQEMEDFFARTGLSLGFPMTLAGELRAGGMVSIAHDRERLLAAVAADLVGKLGQMSAQSIASMVIALTRALATP